MSHATHQVMTAEQLANRPDDGNRYELVQGVLQMISPAGNRHGRIAAKLLVRITNHAEQHDLGTTYAAETGFLIQRKPDTVRAPDVAFVARGRLEAFADHAGYLPLAPDLVAEVVSPSDRSSDIEAKIQSWLDAGVRVVPAVDPQLATIREYRSGSPIRAYTDGFVDLGDVLAGFQLDVTELFA